MSVDWRQSLRSNNRKTYLVIGLFLLIYLALGALVDTYIYASQYPQAPLQTIFIALLTFKLFPLVTLIMLGIAAISLLVTFALHDKLMLLGTEYREITPT